MARIKSVAVTLNYTGDPTCKNLEIPQNKSDSRINNETETNAILDGKWQETERTFFLSEEGRKEDRQVDSRLNKERQRQRNSVSESVKSCKFRSRCHRIS